MNNLETEIKEQAELLDRFGDSEINQIEKVSKIISDINTSGGRVFLSASGSSLNACLYARELFSTDNDMVLEVFPAGESKNHADDIKQDDLVILVSQSGESGNISEVNQLINKTVKKIIITNNKDSKLAKSADILVDLKAGEEKATPATKTYFAEILIFTMISEALSGRILIKEQGKQISEEISRLSSDQILKNQGIEEFKNKKIFILGSGVTWPQAMEAELKFKEIARIDAEAYELSEFFHGPITMLDKNSLVMIFCPKLCNKLDNDLIEKIKKIESKVVAIGSCQCEEADQMIKVNNIKYFDLISIVVAQKLAVELAKLNNIELDNNKGIQKII